MLPKFGLWILNSSDPPPLSKSGINHLIKWLKSGIGHPSDPPPPNPAKPQIKMVFFFKSSLSK